jgi:calcineurin-like phosphoesterase family protein
MPESGETDIPLSWECRKCGYELIVNSEERQVDRLPMISWFYSDPHFSHKNIAKVDYADRPWKEGVEDMNEALVARYNAVVQPSDFVLWVGDCFFCSFKKAKEYMGRLNGRKGLVIGNHDRSKRRMAMMGFEFVVDELMISIGERAVRVNHYPYWNDDYVATDDNRGEGRFKELRPPRVQGEVLIHGHTHSKQQRDGNMIHVGVDAWGYAPVRMKDVRELVQAV